jgi:hypothetical protein
LSWGDPNGEAAMYGMTNQNPESLVPLARSWNRPPNVKMLNNNYAFDEYDYTQRAYCFNNESGGSLNFEILASEGQPLQNLVIIVNNWEDGESELRVDGKRIDEGKNFRQAIEYDVEGNQKFIVFINHKSTETTKIQLL